MQIKVSENCNDLLLSRSKRRRGSEERWRNLEYFAARRRFVGALLEKCGARMMMTTFFLTQRAHEMRDSKHDPGGPQEMNCRRVRRQMQKSDGRASDEKLSAAVVSRRLIRSCGMRRRYSKSSSSCAGSVAVFFLLLLLRVFLCLLFCNKRLFFLPGICPVFLLLLFQFQTCCDFVLSFFRSLAICRGV